MGEKGAAHFGGGYGEEPVKVRDLEAQVAREALEQAETNQWKVDPKVWKQWKREGGP